MSCYLQYSYVCKYMLRHACDAAASSSSRRDLWFQLLFDVVISLVFIRDAFLHFLLYPSTLVFAPQIRRGGAQPSLGNWYVFLSRCLNKTQPNRIECSYFEMLSFTLEASKSSLCDIWCYTFTLFASMCLSIKIFSELVTILKPH